jgi:hypothetical protein
MDADSNPIIPMLIGTKDQGKALRMPTCPFPVHRIKLPSLTKQGSFREFEPRQGQLGGETLTAFGTAGIQNCTTGTGGHPRTKSMATFTFDITGLKGTLTHHLLLVRIHSGKFTSKTG